MKIRAEKPGDAEGITRINDAAFGQKTEGLLVCVLRKDPVFDSQLSFVAELENGHIIGHLLLIPIIIQDDDKRHLSLALAPLSVMPENQKQGVGAALIRHAIMVATAKGHGSIIVLGHPEYYPKFGFSPASKWKIRCPFEVPDNVFMALELQDQSLSTIAGMVKYPAAFSELG